MSKYTHTLLATLGGQPQVVTFTLDLLLQRGFPITEVVVIHPQASEKRLQHSLARLNAEFVGDQYCFNGRPLRCHLRTHILRLDEAPLEDITDDESATGTLDTIHNLICDLKRQHRHIHLSVTGGRRLMSLLALSAAFLLFDRHDHLWHIHTDDAIQQQVKDGAQMHVDPIGTIHLIEGPFVPWGAYFPNQLQSDGTARAQRLSQIAALDSQERQRCDSVVQQLSHRQLDVLRTFASGLSPQEVADHLAISIKTVDTHKTVLLSLCRNAWNKKPSEVLDYRFLQQAFANYFEDSE
ncbi:MAG TPA: CRISPR-associated ring nuclease [Ktedonobacteraceae bacterium]|nr:CRISPR-associated ring nuclease [Ktedonobacteraceae bacterium]